MELPAEKFKRISQHEVAVFRADNLQEASEYWHASRRGNPRAMFFYSDPKNPAETYYGWLYLAFPAGYGLTEKARDEIGKIGHVGKFNQGDELTVWVKDTDIETVLESFFDGLGVLPGSHPFTTQGEQ